MYQKYTIEEFAMDPAFRQWVNHPTRQADLYWEKWIKTHPEQLPAIKKARELVAMDWMQVEKLQESEIDGIWSNIQGKPSGFSLEGTSVIPIHSEAILNRPARAHPTGHRKLWYWSGAGVAAAIVFFLLYAFSVTQPAPPQPIPAQLVLKENPRGQKMTVYLSDGSKVVLNSDSRISYMQNFEPGLRKIRLSGEAYFIVAKDVHRPFIVETENLVVQALGTEFNVRSFDSEAKTEVGLVEGRVAVSSTEDGNGDAKMILDRGEAAYFDKENKAIKKARFDIYSTTAWKDGILVFKKASEGQVLQKLGQWYGVDFDVLNGTLKSWDYTATFERQDLKSVLTSIGFTMGFDYDMDGNTVIIKYLQDHEN